MTVRDRRLLLLLAALASLAVLVAGLFGHEALIAHAAPLFVVLIPLLAGRYLGEERIACAAKRLRPPRRRPSPLALPLAWLRGVAFLPRGGRLLACALAVRPPPTSSLS
jgi:hypothetical protein